jgi:hypothetical protein
VKNHSFEFRRAGDGYRLYIDGEPAGLRIFPKGSQWLAVEPGGEPPRAYAAPELALEEEQKLLRKRYAGIGEHIAVDFKFAGEDRLAVVLERAGGLVTETGFTVEKSETGAWNIIYDNEVWGTGKTMEDVYASMSHIIPPILDILSHSRSIKEFTAFVRWVQNREGVYRLRDGGKIMEMTIREQGGRYYCWNDTTLTGVFPTLAEAQRECTLQHLGRKTSRIYQRKGT